MTQVGRLAEHLTRQTGVQLGRGGLRDSLTRYIARRTQELKLASSEVLVDRVLLGDEEEFSRLVEVISVPHTWFFRDPEQLSGLQAALRLMARDKKTLNVWVPGCATGEDVYSIAILAQAVAATVRIWGTDLCEASLERARVGRYGDFSVRAVPEHLSDHLLRVGRQHQVSPALRASVCFRRHNLLEEPLTAPQGWDLILCRNVLIYFTPETATACAKRLAEVLHPKGWLLFGAGELLHGAPSTLQVEMLETRAVYRRNSDSELKAASQKPASPSAMVPIFPPSSPRQHRPEVESELFSSGSEPAAPGLRLIGLHLQAGDFTLAAQLASAASARAPLDARLRMLSGIALYHANDVAQALMQLRSALLLDDSLWPAALHHGLCLESMGSPSRAQSEYRHLARLLQAPDGGRSLLFGPLSNLGDELLALAHQKSASV